MWKRITSFFQANDEQSNSINTDPTHPTPQHQIDPEPRSFQLFGTISLEAIARDTITYLLEPELSPRYNVEDIQRDLNAERELHLDRTYEFIHGVSRHPQAEASSHETENLGPEPELQPSPLPFNLSRIREELFDMRLSALNLNTSRHHLQSLPNLPYHPNPNNEPTKAWVMYGFNFSQTREQEENTELDETIGLKSLGY